jgi:hypothetical protein
MSGNVDAIGRTYAVQTNGNRFRVVRRRHDQREGDYWEEIEATATYSSKEQAWRRADELEATLPKPWKLVGR